MVNNSAEHQHADTDQRIRKLEQQVKQLEQQLREPQQRVQTHEHPHTH